MIIIAIAVLVVINLICCFSLKPLMDSHDSNDKIGATVTVIILMLNTLLLIIK